MPRPKPLLAWVAFAAAVALIAGCGGSSGPVPRVVPSRIADLNVPEMTEARVPFCDLVPRGSIRAALRGAAITSQSWGVGDTPPLAAAQADVSGELGCAWTRARYAAGAWVFARPVTATFAREVIASSRTRHGCSTRTSVAFGKPGLLQTCPLPGRRTRFRHAGLFGDTWLTCEVTGPRGDAGTVSAVARADGWCAAVAAVLDSRGSG